MRPPGYEPGELPTAPPRDMNFVKRNIVSQNFCKGTKKKTCVQIFWQKIRLLCKKQREEIVNQNIKKGTSAVAKSLVEIIQPYGAG